VTAEPITTNGASTEPSAVEVECSACGHVGEPVGKGQCERCRCWLPRNEGALVHGRRRYEGTGLVPPELADFLADLRGAVVEDLGGEDLLSRVQLLLVDRLVELEGSARLSLDFALRAGADTKRGRDSLADHRSTTDSQLRVAKAIGLRRAPRRVPSLDDLLGRRLSPASQDASATEARPTTHGAGERSSGGSASGSGGAGDARARS
jgi:hypothetical protein